MPLIQNINRWIERFTGRNILSISKHNEVVDRLNPLQNISVWTGSPRNEVVYSQRGVFIHVATPIWSDEPGAAPASVGCYKLVSFDFTTLTCRTWDGVAPGPDDVYIATPPKFREAITTETLPGPITVNYSGYSDASQTRSANNGVSTKTQQVTPPYLVGDLIYAISAPTFLTDPFGSAVTLIDLNLDGRAWATQT